MCALVPCESKYNAVVFCDEYTVVLVNKTLDICNECVYKEGGLLKKVHVHLLRKQGGRCVFIRIVYMYISYRSDKVVWV